MSPTLSVSYKGGVTDADREDDGIKRIMAKSAEELKAILEQNKEAQELFGTAKTTPFGSVDTAGKPTKVVPPMVVEPRRRIKETDGFTAWKQKYPHLKVDYNTTFKDKDGKEFNVWFADTIRGGKQIFSDRSGIGEGIILMNDAHYATLLKSVKAENHAGGRKLTETEGFFVNDIGLRHRVGGGTGMSSSEFDAELETQLNASKGKGVGAGVGGVVLLSIESAINTYYMNKRLTNIKQVEYAQLKPAYTPQQAKTHLNTRLNMLKNYKSGSDSNVDNLNRMGMIKNILYMYKNYPEQLKQAGIDVPTNLTKDKLYEIVKNHGGSSTPPAGQPVDNPVDTKPSDSNPDPKPVDTSSGFDRVIDKILEDNKRKQSGIKVEHEVEVTPDIRRPHLERGIMEQESIREEKVHQSYSSGLGFTGSSGDPQLRNKDSKWMETLQTYGQSLKFHLIGALAGASVGFLSMIREQQTLATATKGLAYKQYFVRNPQYRKPDRRPQYEDMIDNRQGFFGGILEYLGDEALNQLELGELGSTISMEDHKDAIKRIEKDRFGLFPELKAYAHRLVGTSKRDMTSLFSFIFKKMNGYSHYYPMMFAMCLFGLLAGDLVNGILGNPSASKRMLKGVRIDMDDIADETKAKYITRLVSEMSPLLQDKEEVPKMIQYGLYVMRKAPSNKNKWKQFIDEALEKFVVIFGKSPQDYFTENDVDTMNTFSGNDFSFLRDNERFKETLYTMATDQGVGITELTFRNFVNSMSDSKIDLKDTTSWMGKYFKDFTVSIEGSNYKGLERNIPILGYVELPQSMIPTSSEHDNKNLIAEHFAGKNFRYGEYGGRGNKIDSNGEAIGFSGGKTPVDKLDAIFKEHDENYARLGDFSPQADKIMIDAIDELLKDANNGLSDSAIEKAKGVRWYFSNIAIHST